MGPSERAAHVALTLPDFAMGVRGDAMVGAHVYNPYVPADRHADVFQRVTVVPAPALGGFVGLVFGGGSKSDSKDAYDRLRRMKDDVLTLGLRATENSWVSPGPVGGGEYFTAFPKTRVTEIAAKILNLAKFGLETVKGIANIRWTDQSALYDAAIDSAKAGDALTPEQVRELNRSLLNTTADIGLAIKDIIELINAATQREFVETDTLGYDPRVAPEIAFDVIKYCLAREASGAPVGPVILITHGSGQFAAGRAAEILEFLGLGIDDVIVTDSAPVWSPGATTEILGGILEAGALAFKGLAGVVAEAVKSGLGAILEPLTHNSSRPDFSAEAIGKVWRWGETADDSWVWKRERNEVTHVGPESGRRWSAEQTALQVANKWIPGNFRLGVPINSCVPRLDRSGLRRIAEILGSARGWDKASRAQRLALEDGLIRDLLPSGAR
jgi:hypothetical protein